MRFFYPLNETFPLAVERVYCMSNANKKGLAFCNKTPPRIIGVFLLCERLRFTSVFEYQSGEASYMAFKTRYAQLPQGEILVKR